MVHRFRCPIYVIAALLIAVVTACSAGVPTRPEELREGTFGLTFEGVIARPQRVAVDESIIGTACRIGEFIRLDDKSLTRRLLIHFPNIAPTPVRYAFAYPGQHSTAEAHLNLGSDIQTVSSLMFVDGSATVVARRPEDTLGTLEAELAQAFLDSGLVADSLTVRGVFRASRCSDWPYPQL
jgi:hypothetical protein